MSVTVSVEVGTTWLDLTLFFWPEGDGIGGLAEYNRDLFEAATIVAGSASSPGRSSSDCPNYMVLSAWVR